MKKKIIYLIIALCLAVSMLTVMAFAASPDVPTSGICGDNLTWTLVDGTLNIYGTGAMKDLPDFGPSENITNVIINDGVTSIGIDAFYECSSLTSVTIPDSVTSIGEAAFFSCESLRSVELPDGITTIEKSTFSQCKNLISVVLPDNLVSIGDGAFHGCENLASIEFPETLRSIGSNAFYYCHSLTSIEIPLGVTEIPYGGFYMCSSLSSVKLPEGIVSIGFRAFYGCRALGSIEFPASLTKIDKFAFEYCNNLKKIYFNGSKAPEIGYQAFSWVYGATAYYIPGDEAWDLIIDDDKYEAYDHGGIIKWVPYTGSHTHNYTDKVTAPTCTAEGYTTHTCACGDSYTDTTVAATGHKWDGGAVTTEPTIETEGVKTFTCTVCGETKTEKINKLPDPNAPVENPFTDVSENDFFFEPVMWAVSNNVTSGLSATSFGPSKGCTRAQVVTFLWRAAGEPAPTSNNNPFTDVKEGQYYYDAVLWAVENGITTGLNATTFGTNADCNRGQIVTFLWRAMGKPAPTSSNNPFTDVPESQYYYDAVLWAVEKGITTGLSATSFGPNSTCTRGQIVTFLYRAYQ